MMSNVYLTLLSDVTQKYSSNVANQFKVIPGLRLHGEGWKVSIVSAILPKMSFKDLQSETNNLFFNSRDRYLQCESRLYFYML